MLCIRRCNTEICQPSIDFGESQHMLVYTFGFEKGCQTAWIQS
jgi:hypothetical protein